MENVEQKRRRIMGEQFLPKYLNELNKLLNIKVTEENLLSITDTDLFINETSGKLKDTPPFYKETILFGNKIKLKEMIEKKVSIFNTPYYIYIIL